MFHYHEAKPNFITNKKICAEILHIDQFDRQMNIQGKILLIEKADPGYDWIFGHKIAGIITKYGGVASHMSIRAAEFGLPAAIGCGDIIFEQLINAENIELNCSTNQIQVIK
jgi:phosphoenolpyruvate-protein kinase (PTS system EI component)